MEDKEEKTETMETMETSETEEQMSVSSKSRYAEGFMSGVLVSSLLFLVIVLVGSYFLKSAMISKQQGADRASLVDEETEYKIDTLALLVKNMYYEDVDEQKMREGLYKGLVKSLDDPYSAYYTSEEYEEMMMSAKAMFNGIGVVLLQDPKTMQVQIVRVYDDSPALEAGLKAGDFIKKVEDIEATSMEVSELVSHIRGKQGTSVHLQIIRSGKDGVLDFDVERREVEVPTVGGRMLTDDTGYVIISEFGKATAESFKQEVEELDRQGMKKLIVDLRDNPGGMVDSVCEILDYILPEGLIVYTEDKNGKRQEQRSDAKQYLDYPMAVLINGNSASCSEIFAGAIRDHDYGLLIGTTTYGKGVMQDVRQLPDKSAVKLTMARYFTPKGENIHGKGIAPDIELKYKYSGDKDASEYDYLSDNQIKRAIKELQNK